MAELARLTHTTRGAPQRPRRTAPQLRYMGFLSYSHQDAAIADWLHEALEQFRVPPRLVGKLTEHGPVPKRLAPIFRDQRELAAAHDLGEEIEEAIEASRFLIVLCSPAAAKSRWIDEEIACFKRLHREDRILAAIIFLRPGDLDGPGTDYALYDPVGSNENSGSNFTTESAMLVGFGGLAIGAAFGTFVIAPALS